MCLTVFAYQTDPEYPLIFASNRDEFYDRPAQHATFWYDYPTLLAGRDLKAGGTWLGLTKDHRFAAITNYRDMTSTKKDAPSRGDIVTNYLTSDKPAPVFLDELHRRADLYNGFNLIAGTTDKLWYYSNQKKVVEEIEPGIHTLSNAFLNTPWPKTEKAKRFFTNILDSDRSNEKLFEILRDKERFPNHLLPSTGLSPDMERVVSSIFITSENYGTRCSTIIKADPTTVGNTSFNELTYKPGTSEAEKRVAYSF